MCTDEQAINKAPLKAAILDIHMSITGHKVKRNSIRYSVFDRKDLPQRME